LDELNRGHHVLHHAVDDGVTVERAEILQRRAAIIVDQNVGVRAGGQESILNGGIRNIARHFMDGRSCRIPNLACGCVQKIDVTSVNRDLAASLGQRNSAAFA
jgi:hypothetical protein